MRMFNGLKLKSAVALATALVVAVAAPGHAEKAVVVHGKRVIKDGGQCINLPLRGVEVVNNHTIALIAKDGGVALVRLSAPCMKGRSQQIAIRPASTAEQICSKRDILEVFNAQIEGFQGTCAAVAFRYVGKLDETGIWDPKTEASQSR